MEQLEMSSEVAEFYRGKTLFVTGGAGFLGEVLLEILLRCCPGICRIYLLLRSKKGVQPEDRMEAIFQKEIFREVNTKHPDVFDKVVVVSGDISQENLGMKEEDLLKVTREVSIIFHCAASVSFHKSLSFLVNQNVMGTKNVIDFCRKLTQLQVLVYTSTAFSNCNRTDAIDEKVYKLPFAIEQVLEASRFGNEKELLRLFRMCGSHPNYYTFSKSVTENLLAESAKDLPVTIVRPSIIIFCYKGPLPGFIEYGTGLVNLCVGVGRGFIRVLRCDGTKKFEFIPVDVVANTHIIGAYNHVTESLPSPFVYNCTSGEIVPFTWRSLYSCLLKMVLEYPLPKSYQIPSVSVCKSRMKYKLFSLLDHYTPAVVIDSWLWITRRKPRLFKLYQFYDKCMKGTEPFTMNNWDFICENFNSLSAKLNPTDQELFPVDLKDFSIEDEIGSLRTGAPIYKHNGDKPQEEGLLLTFMRYYLTSLIKWSVLGGLASIFYIALF